MASLEKHNQPLDNRLAKHLLRRACFHYSQELLNESEGKTPEQVLSILKKNKEKTVVGEKMVQHMLKSLKIKLRKALPHKLHGLYWGYYQLAKLNLLKLKEE